MKLRLELGSLKYFAVCSMIIGFLNSFAYSQEPACCDQAPGSCASVCKQLSLVTLASETDLDVRDRHLRSVHMLCPSQLTGFWQCMNETLDALRGGANWEGRYCCSMAQTRLCQISCLTAQESNELVGGCRRSDESAVYQCLERQEEYEACCGHSNKSECITACKNFLRDTPQRSKRHGAKKRLNSVCEREMEVLSCVANLTQATPVQNAEKYLPCCSRGRNGECQEACRRALKSSSSDQVIMEALVEKGCGQPRPDDKMWQCFLQNSEPRGTELPSRIDRLGMDTAKLHCCHRASSTTCRRLCYKTYSREWTGSWSDLDSVCLSSPAESSLRACVDEVEEPCELGCDGLSFCSAFNNRPSELFRRCNPSADLAARQQFEQWKALGYIPLSETMKLPLKDLSQCATEKWKTVACALQLKPCHPKTHVSQICRSDCASLLHECVDFDNFLMTGGHDIGSICELLSPPPKEPCISISSYIQPKNTQEDFEMDQKITRPCRSRPCNSTEICSVNRECPSGNCFPYTCQPGCSLGEVSRLIVAPGTWIRVPSQGSGCQRLCRCSEDGRMEQCLSSVCEPPTVCWLGQNRIEHASHFRLECNLCSCRSGELICSKRQCGHKDESSNTLFSSSSLSTEVDLPCNCSPARSPVCGSNGRTYPNNCLAKCGGLSDADITRGECGDKDPCEGVFCGNGRRCIPSRRICLIPLSRRCQQFQCVPLKCEESWVKTLEPICDTAGRQHNNLCSMANSGALLGYKGKCLENGCSSEGVVCGIDGETYSSECAAQAHGIPVDYNGPCMFIGTSDGSQLKESCSSKAHCKALPSNCIGVTPAGSCCPICGGVIRIIYSPTQVLRMAESTDTPLITVDDMTNRLSSLVQTAQCRVGVYLSFAGTELIVVIQPVSKFWTLAQIQACISESDRLATIISQQSPIVQVDAMLSVLAAASSTPVSSQASWTQSSNSNIYLLATLVLIALKLSNPKIDR